MTSVLDTLDNFEGDIVEPGAADYESARRAVLTVGSPAYVLRPAGVGDVRAAVRFAASSGLPLAVRGGGHSFPGFATNDGGLVIDLSRLSAVSLGGGSLVRVGGGATWGAVADALDPHGLAISSGDTRSVGVGGLTLSGGIGWKVRKHGLALDSLVGAEVVTADGSVLRADATENPSLFWALRGGGGNFGVVTAFEFEAQPTTAVHHGKLSFPATSAAAVLQGWATYMRGAPEELTAIATLANPFAGGPDAPVEIHLMFDGDDPSAAATAIDPIRRLAPLLTDDVTLKPYGSVLEAGMTPPPGIRLVTRSAFIAPASVSAALAHLVEAAASGKSPFLAIRTVGGAVSRVADDATAYPHRKAELLVVATTLGPDPVIAAATPALNAFWHRLAPHTMGAYANFLSSSTEVDVAAVYPPNTYRRLATAKRQYDPSNLFAANHNVRPQ
ncbi:FAD-binding oxidoreductase [Actinoplanes subtropicus]|uniref:FAD-binding oxidoreductase n=1 Tax=Actinoplanes subtropicus TaxID=543632 RepID=UPI0004C304AC|nr:FAD-binding oxidoreductase [Actinoplanes subtropicus]